MPLGPRRPARATVRRGRRRQLVWATFDNNISLSVATSNNTVDLLNQLELAGTSKVGVTVMAVNYKMAVVGLTATEDLEYGISVVRDTDIGTTRVNPNADNNLDWMIFERVFATFSGATADAATILERRLKSKRRCHEIGQTLGFSATALPAATVTVHLFARTLVALP
jgi:hypothetical protein